jgi:adenylosuccinate lyase
MTVFENNDSFKQALLDEPELKGVFTESELDELLRPENYIGLAGDFVDKVLAAGCNLSKSSV